MGWTSTGAVFDSVAKALVELNAPADTKTRVLGDLIGALQEGDWDTEDESLDAFRDDPAIVEAFGQHGVTIDCGASRHSDSDWCKYELGHEPPHVDYDGNEWTDGGARPETDTSSGSRTGATAKTDRAHTNGTKGCAVSEPQDAAEWEDRYRERVLGAMHAAAFAVNSVTGTAEDTDEMVVAQIEAAGRIAAALILADKDAP